MSNNQKFGGLTEDDIKQNRREFFSLDYQKAKFKNNDEEYPGVRGTFRGVGSNEFEWEGQKIRKFTVFLENNGTLMQVETGFNTWTTYQIMNLLLNCNGSLKNSIVTLALVKTPEKKTTLFMQVNGNYMKYKFKFADMKFPEGKDAREKHVAKVIAKWYDELIKLYEYKTEPQAVEEFVDEVAADDIPF